MSAAPTRQAEPAPLEFLTAVLEDAYIKGLLPDSLSEQLANRLVDNLIAQHTGETREQAIERLGDSFLGPVLIDQVGEVDRIGIYGSRYWFSLLIAAIEDAYSAETLTDALVELLTDWFIGNLIALETGETSERVRERLSVPLPEPTLISDTFGTLANPAPLGTTGLMSDGIAVTITSSNLDATDIVGSLSAPPAPGNKYVLVHVRIENVSGGEYAHKIPHYFFGLIGSSGRIVRNSHYRDDVCKGATRHLDYRDSLDRGQSVNTILCFEVSEDAEGLRVFYESIARYINWRRILGFWATSAEVAPPTPPEARSVSDTYGTRANPVPLGENALKSDGVAITVLSANLDATKALKDARGGHYCYSAQGNKCVTIRVRVQDVTGREDDQYNVRSLYTYSFGLVASSGLVVIGGLYDGCRSAEELNVFKGGWAETELCFEIPVEENNLILFYDGVDGFWDVSSNMAPPAPVEPATPISDAYGTLVNPVPFGEKAGASNGIAITVTGSNHDAVGGRVIVRVRVEGFGEESALHQVDHDDFRMVSSSGMIVNSDGYECEQHDYGMEVEVIEGGWQEGSLCFNVPAGDTDPIIVYIPEEFGVVSERVLGFWAASDGASPQSREKPPVISDAFGTLANPVPAGESALTSDGVAITVVSSLIDATMLGYPPSDTHTTVVVRARVEGFSEDANKLRRLRYRDFGIVGNSAILRDEDSRMNCRLDGLDLEYLDVQFFTGGWKEFNLCFKVPTRETDLKIYYKPKGGRPSGWILVRSSKSRHPRSCGYFRHLWNAPKSCATGRKSSHVRRHRYLCPVRRYRHKTVA